MAKTKATMKLVGEDGNAFSIMRRAISAMKKAKVDAKTIAEYQKEAMSGDYDNLLCTTMDYVNCDGDDEEETEEEEEELDEKENEEELEEAE